MAMARTSIYWHGSLHCKLLLSSTPSLALSRSLSLSPCLAVSLFSYPSLAVSRSLSLSRCLSGFPCLHIHPWLCPHLCLRLRPRRCVHPWLCSVLCYCVSREFFFKAGKEDDESIRCWMIHRPSLRSSMDIHASARPWEFLMVQKSSALAYASVT